MIIAGANLSLAASHRHEVNQAQNGRLIIGTGVRTPPEGDESPLMALRQAVADLKNHLPAPSDYQTGKLAKQARQQSAKADQQEADHLDPKQREMITLLERIFGFKGIKTFNLNLDYSSVQEVQSAASAALSAQTGQTGTNVSYDYHSEYSEYEATNLAMAGTFTTEDGRSFSFKLSYQMERLYQRTSDISVRAGNSAPPAKDPLILDQGAGGQISPIRTAFDLDRDGWVDLLPHLTGPSRYLAADLNNNNQIDNGGELFGPDSGNGFADLATHDSDGNGFIDQGDPIWNQLRLWSGDDSQPTLLSAWKIAAIGLQSITAPFTYTDKDNQPLAQNRSAGVYLTDDGKAGVVKQVDLVA